VSNPKIVGISDAGWVQVPSDSTGKRIAHYAVDVQQSDGSTQTVYYPLFMVADTDGNVSDLRMIDGTPALAVTDKSTRAMLEETVVLLGEIKELLMRGH